MEVADAIPQHIYSDIIRTMGAPSIITREWLDTHQAGCIGSSKNPIYYIGLREGQAIRLANGTYITEPCYIPYDTMLPAIICYKDNMEIGAYSNNKFVYKVHTTGSLYGLKWYTNYFVINKVMTNIGNFQFTSNGDTTTYREVLINGNVCQLKPIDIARGVEICNMVGYNDLSANNLLYKIVLEMLTVYKLGDEIALLDDTTGIVNRLFTRIVQTYNNYLKTMLPQPLYADWAICKMRESHWGLLLQYPVTVPLIFNELVKRPELIKTMTTEVYDMILANSKEYKINPEIVRKFVKTNALKYDRQDLVNYVGLTQTRCRRPSPLGLHA